MVTANIAVNEVISGERADCAARCILVLSSMIAEMTMRIRRI